jgi:hypothetical protein
MALPDPTRSQSKRERWERKFRARWRTVRGRVRTAFEGGGGFQPLNDRPVGQQASEFREWLTSVVDEKVVKPTPARPVRQGDHYTAPFAHEMFEHGLRRAAQALSAAGHDVADPAPDVILRRDQPNHGGPGHYDEWLTNAYVETYQDLRDAAQAAVKAATRTYRQAVREGWAIADTVSAINDRLDKTGRHRTDLVTRAKAVVIINDAALARYEAAGVGSIGVAAESARVPDADVATDGGRTVDGHDHAHAEQLATERTHPAPGEDDAARHRWVTAGDARVCPQCSALAGSVYLIDDIRAGDAPMPVRDTHPGCRCYLVPVSAE